MCSCSSGFGNGIGSACESPLASWLAPWLPPEDENLRKDILCSLMDYQINCIKNQLEGADNELSQRQKAYLQNLLTHLQEIQGKLVCS